MGGKVILLQLSEALARSETLYRDVRVTRWLTIQIQSSSAGKTSRVCEIQNIIIESFNIWIQSVEVNDLVSVVFFVWFVRGLILGTNRRSLTPIL